MTNSKIENIEGKLKITNLGFPSFDFTQDLEHRGTIKTQFSFRVAYKIISEKERRVRLYVQITGEDGRFSLNIVEQANAELVNAELLDDEGKERILRENSVAIMFPYMRSQVALLTSQPRMMPIQIPIVDVGSLVANSEIEEE